MAKQIINIGSTENDGTGDTGRVGGQKINENFTEVYGHVESGHAPVDADNTAANETSHVDVLVDGDIGVNVAAALGTDDNYVTDAEKTVIGNTSGTNTGDQDISGKVDVSGDDMTGSLSIQNTIAGDIGLSIRNLDTGVSSTSSFTMLNNTGDIGAFLAPSSNFAYAHFADRFEFWASPSAAGADFVTPYAGQDFRFYTGGLTAADEAVRINDSGNLLIMNNKDIGETASRINKGWFVDLDVSGSVQLANQIDAIKSGDYPIQMKSAKTDGATSEGFVFDTDNDMLVTEGSKPLVFKNNGIDILSIYKSSGNGKTLRAAVNRGDFGIGGIANVLTGNSWVFGQGHSVASNNGFTSGQNNTMAGDYAAAIGFGNTANGNGNTSIGLNNNISLGIYNTSIGSANSVQGFGGVAIGINNTSGIGYSGAYVIGSQNILQGSGSAAFGVSNKDSGQRGNTIIGSYNTSIAIDNVIFGRYLTSSYTKTIMVGSGLTTTNVLQAPSAESLSFGVLSTVPTVVVKPSVAGGGVGDIGNVGIGTSTPTERLHVDGSLRLQDSLIHQGTTAGFFSTTPVTQPAAMTAADISTPTGTDASIIANLQTRIEELESKLQDLGLLA